MSVTQRGGPFEGISAAVVRRRGVKMLEQLGIGGAELSIALVDDATIQELNRTWRDKDKPTDVLAFPMQDAPARGRRGPQRSSVAVVDGALLGDVIVSMDTARRQAAEHGRTVLQEVTMLLAHGLLHLVGYDHRTDAEEREMNARTTELQEAAERVRRV